MVFYSEPLDLHQIFCLILIFSKYFDEGEKKMASTVKRADLDLQFKDPEIQ